MPGGPVHPYQLDESISNFRGVWCAFSFLFNLANSVDPDQTPHSAASDLGLHCLPRSQKRETTCPTLTDNQVMEIGPGLRVSSESRGPNQRPLVRKAEMTIPEPHHEKTCLTSYANSKDTDQCVCAVWSVPLWPVPLLLTVKIVSSYRMHKAKLRLTRTLLSWLNYNFATTNIWAAAWQNQIQIELRWSWCRTCEKLKTEKVNKVEKRQKLTAGLNPNHMHIFKPWKKRCAKFYMELRLQGTHYLYTSIESEVRKWQSSKEPMLPHATAKTLIRLGGCTQAILLVLSAHIFFHDNFIAPDHTCLAVQQTHPQHCIKSCWLAHLYSPEGYGIVYYTQVIIHWQHKEQYQILCGLYIYFTKWYFHFCSSFIWTSSFFL